jgi:putative transposase
MADDRKPEPGSAEVAKRMAVLRQHLHDAVPLGEAATDAGISIRTARRWLTGSVSPRATTGKVWMPSPNG